MSRAEGVAAGPGAAAAEERAARAVLARVAEPAEPELGAALDGDGPVAVVDRLRAGDLDVPGALPMRARLADADGVEELARGRAAGARYVIPGDPDWPQALDDLGPVRPYGLWVRGALPLGVHAARAVAIVGSRAATAYGRHVATELAAALAEAGLAVVSGCAFGIDAAAHRGTLAVGGVTLGVLAGGVDVPYPRAHEALLGRIAAEGVVLSEAACGAAPAKRRFLTRNRLIAALGRGTLVVEAARRSGAATTARWADELSRPLMAVPGPVTSACSAGTHHLIRERGAVLVTSAAEVLEAVARLGEDLAPVLRGPTRPHDGLPDRLLAVLEALPARAPAQLEAVAAECGLTPGQARAALGELAVLALVERVDGGWRVRRAGR